MISLTPSHATKPKTSTKTPYVMGLYGEAFNTASLEASSKTGMLLAVCNSIDMIFINSGKAIIGTIYHIYPFFNRIKYNSINYLFSYHIAHFNIPLCIKYIIKMSLKSMNNVYVYTCIFLKISDYTIWEDVMEKLEQDAVIFKVMKVTNLYLFRSRYKTQDLRNLIDTMCNGTQTYIIKQEEASKLKEKDFTIMNLDSIYSKEWAEENMVTKERKKKNTQPVKNVDWDASSVEIADTILEKISLQGIESLTAQEQKWLSDYSNGL